MACRASQREVAVAPLQAPGAELPPLLQTLRRPVLRYRAVEQEALPLLAARVRHADRPVVVADLETFGLQTSHTQLAGSEELSLPWRYKVDKGR